MTQTVTGAVAVRQKQDQLVDWLRAQQSEIAMIAATHIKPSAIVRVAHGALRRDPKLMAAAIANPLSLLNALLDAARLGHEPDTDDYYLVPFGNEVTGIEGYKGIIERMYRAGAVSSVVAEVVYQKDVYRRTGATTPPVHEYDEFADPDDRGPLRGAYAYAVMLDGRFSKIIPMGRAEIMKHKAMSKGSDRSDSPWQRWEESMWKKCPLRGLEPYVPTSTEYRHAPANTPVRVASMPQNAYQLPAGNGHPAEPVIDGEIIEDPGPAVPDETPVSGPAAGPGPTPAETASQPVAKQEPPRPPSKNAVERLQSLIRQIPLGEDHDIAALLAWITGRPDVLEADLTSFDVKAVTTLLDDALKTAGGDVAEAASQVWTQYRASTEAGDG